MLAADEFAPYQRHHLSAYKYSYIHWLLTLGIGGVVSLKSCWFPSMNESARSACGERWGARKWHIKNPVPRRDLLIMLLGGAIGIVVPYVVPQPSAPCRSWPLFETTPAKPTSTEDSLFTLMVSPALVGSRRSERADPRSEQRI